MKEKKKMKKKEKGENLYQFAFCLNFFIEENINKIEHEED